jgi:hypothetical protein
MYTFIIKKKKKKKDVDKCMHKNAPISIKTPKVVK